MAASEFQSEDFGDESHVQSYQGHPNLVTVALFLGGLIALSERPDMVSGASSRGALLAARGWGSG